jgi:hypothetical protein
VDELAHGQLSLARHYVEVGRLERALDALMQLGDDALDDPAQAARRLLATA